MATARADPRKGDAALARQALTDMLGPRAEFRPGQLEAIEAVLRPSSKVLVVQGTGWGKSIIYFVAARLLRARDAGPTLVVSPLLSLMRNQVAAASALGVGAAALTSENHGEWDDIQQGLISGRLDLLLVSPERLAYGGFRRHFLQQLPRGIGMLVIDEAHCVSDWGHDFRPDYRRVVRLTRETQRHVRVLATTGTADAHVVADLTEQLGEDLTILRGPLDRPSLRLQTIRLDQPARRLAWLSSALPRMSGSGIIYCLTRFDTEVVSDWLRRCGIDAPAYHAGLPPEERQRREELLLGDKCKALCATVALGMGLDKPDLAFVVHYQRPRSVVDYYQQVGRAGRAIPEAYGVLLTGAEDHALASYFAGTGFPPAECQRAVLEVIEGRPGLTEGQIAAHVNLPMDRIEQCLKLLRADDAVSWRAGKWYRSRLAWTPDHDRSAQIAARRLAEMAQIEALTRTQGCLMEFVGRELADPCSAPCGRCANCAGPVLRVPIRRRAVRQAKRQVARRHPTIVPHTVWPAGLERPDETPIEPDRQMERGKALCVYGEPRLGRMVAEGKRRGTGFPRGLVRASARLIREWNPQPTPTWITNVPSLRRPGLVEGFARALARALGLQYRAALEKHADVPEQKHLLNDILQCTNARDSFRADRSRVLLASPVLLVDDTVDSRWTLTVCAALLREAGSGPVIPFALAAAIGTARP